MPNNSNTQQHVAGKSAGASAAQIRVSDEGDVLLPRKDAEYIGFTDISVHDPYLVKVRDYGYFAIMKFTSDEIGKHAIELDIFFDNVQTIRDMCQKVIEIIDSGKAKRNNE